MRSALIAIFFFLPAVSFATDAKVDLGPVLEKFELPQRGAEVLLEGEKIPAPFSYLVCEQALSSEKSESLREQFSPKNILDVPSRNQNLKSSVWQLFNMKPVSIDSWWWHVEFAEAEDKSPLFRIVRSGGTIAYERPIPREAMISPPQDESAKRSALRYPYVVLEERHDVRILLFADNKDGRGEYRLGVEVPCSQIPNYLNLPIPDVISDNSLVERDGQIVCRFEVSQLLPQSRSSWIRSGGKPWWKDRKPAPSSSGNRMIMRPITY